MANDFEERKKEIRTRIEKLSSLFDSSASVSTLLTDQYHQLSDEVKKLSQENKEKLEKIQQLHDEKERLTGQLEKTEEIVEKVRGEGEKNSESLLATIQELEKKIGEIEGGFDKLKSEESHNAVDLSEKAKLLTLFEQSINDFVSMLKNAEIPRGKFNEAMANATVLNAEKLSPYFEQFSEENKKWLRELKQVVEQIKDPGFLPERKTFPQSLHVKENDKGAPAVSEEGVLLSEKGSNGERIYTLIEKIENSKVDIHSQTYGNMPPAYPYPPGMAAMGVPSEMPITMAPFPFPPPSKKKPQEENEEEPQTEAEPEATGEPDPEPEAEAEGEPESELKPEAEPETEPEKEEEPPPAAFFNPYSYSDDIFDDWKPEDSLLPDLNKKPEKKKLPEEKLPPIEKPEPPPKSDELTHKIDINLHEDDYEKYGKYLKLTYLFDNMPDNLSYSKYKKPLRSACRITLLGNLEEGLNMFNTLKQQKLPDEYKEMIDKNIRDVKYYLRGKYRSAEADKE